MSHLARVQAPPEGVKRAARWLVVGGLAVYGFYELGEGFRYITTEQQFHWVFGWLFLAPVTVCFSGFLFALSWLALTRQYRRLCRPVALILAAIALIGIASIPEWLGLDRWARTQGSFSPLGFVGNIICLVVLVQAWRAAKWVYRHALPRLLGYVDAAWQKDACQPRSQ